MNGDGDVTHLQIVANWRADYRRLVQELPWLDMSVWPDELSAFAEYAPAHDLPGVTALAAEPSLVGHLGSLQAAHDGLLLRFDPARSGSLDAPGQLYEQMIRHRVPLVVLHTDVPMRQIAVLAQGWPDLPIIVESGPLKLLYHITELEGLLSAHSNMYLCTYNLCNWLGLERLCERGFGGRLLFGTHQPRYSPHAAMAPIAMGRFDWRRKCDLAGNNLRRLLDMPEVHPTECALRPVAPFVVDAHTHSGPPERFPVPDEQFGPGEWLDFMDLCGLEHLCMCPYQALVEPGVSAQELMHGFRVCAPERFSYFEVFDPRDVEGSLRQVRSALDDPGCIGIKIHPSMHEVEADADAYSAVYELAGREQVPILTHSWEVSATNPVQHLSYPSRFAGHLREHPEVTLVLGHAGGRPGAIDAVVQLCTQFPKVSVDLSGDYYDAGLVECLSQHVGAERVIFASDMNWIDPRCNLGPVLASSLPDHLVLDVLRDNAVRTYGLAAGGGGR